MNSKQAKELPLPDFLAQLGYQPANVRGPDIWYRSPFRPDERTPSFKIDRNKNVWFDFGLGQGGTIIDFVQHLYQLNDVSRVLSTIADVSGGVVRLTVAPANRALMVEVAPKEKPVIEAVTPIRDPALEAYLASREIPLDLARLYLQEVSYRAEGRPYRALAFPNDSGGFEVRNPGFKGTLGTKDITYLANAERRDATIFEGAFDFLSALAYYRRERPASNVLILNSTGMVERAVDRLRGAGIDRLQTYLDHDEGGERARAFLEAQGMWEMVDASGLYRGHKDMNAFWKACRQRSDERDR